MSLSSWFRVCVRVLFDGHLSLRAVRSGYWGVRMRWHRGSCKTPLARFTVIAPPSVRLFVTDVQELQATRDINDKPQLLVPSSAILTRSNKFVPSGSIELECPSTSWLLLTLEAFGIQQLSDTRWGLNSCVITDSYVCDLEVSLNWPELLLTLCSHVWCVCVCFLPPFRFAQTRTSPIRSATASRVPALTSHPMRCSRSSP